MPPSSRPTGPLPWPVPNISLRIDDLDHEGVKVFQDNIDAKTALHVAIEASFHWLYTAETVPRSVEKIALILRSMPGVAHTTGSNTHKEIHMSLDYILSVESRAQGEIMGVLVHEMVHCFQHNARNSCPGGLIEGVADWVRLNAGHAPPHWRQRAGEHWDAGYETTGYFLEFIETLKGKGSIRDLNAALSDVEYSDKIFETLTGMKVGKLWKVYCGSLEKQ